MTLLSSRLEVTQGQGLALTPQLLKAMELLEMSDLDLSLFLDQAISENPFLDYADLSDRDLVNQDDMFFPHQTITGIGESAIQEVSNQFDFGLARCKESWIESRDLRGEGRDMRSMLSSRRGEPGSLVSLSMTEHRLVQPISLHDHILDQVALELRDDLERSIALALIDHLDDIGYLQADLTLVANQFNVDRAFVEAVLMKVQQFDPAGIFARSLQECLVLQLRNRDRLTPAMRVLLKHLDLIADCRFESLCNICSVNEHELSAMIQEIQELNPKPALVFDHSPEIPLLPDLLMFPEPHDEWCVIPNPKILPHIKITQDYTGYINNIRTQAEQDYLSKHLSEAYWLIRSLRKREKIIVAVASAIIDHQKSFLCHGESYLKPLTLRAISDSIGIHESTISRSVSNKVISTPRGLFRLKHFFASAISKHSDYSSDMVCWYIRDLIQTESAEQTLSDDQIMTILQDNKIDVTRRTVTKYRERMRIPSSIHRRRQNLWKIKLKDGISSNL